jgi:hypothetical protein
MESRASDQAERETNIDTKVKTPTVWKEEEYAKLCELFHAQWDIEKVSEQKTTALQLWSLMSKQLLEHGIKKTSSQCMTRWYYHVRFRPEFKDTFQFSAIPKSKLNTGNALSKSQVDLHNDNHNSRWKKDEMRKLKELVLAYRSSTLQDQQQHGMPFWALISQQLESHDIYRSSQACAVKWRRYNSDQVSPTTPDVDSDDILPSLCGSKLDNDDADVEEEEPRRGSRQRISRPRWTDEEHDKLVELLKARRELENQDEGVEKLSCWKLFVLVSKQLEQSFIDRSASACQHYWNSKGFQRSGFDINPPTLLQPGRDSGKSTVLDQLSPLAKDIADAFFRLPQQHFDDSPVVEGFRKVWHLIHYIKFFCG